MFHLNDKFKGKLSPAKWRNKVSAFLNNICGDGCIEVMKPEEPNSGNPPQIRIRWLAFLKQLGKKGVCGAQPNTYEIGATTSQTLANAQALAAEAPQSDKYVDTKVATGNTAQQIADNQIALIGTSEKVAREDHRHPVETAQGTAEFRPTTGTKTSTMEDDTGDSDYPSGEDFALKTDTWKLNDTDGFSLLAISRVVEEPNDGIHILFFREVKYSKNGNAISVGAEIGATKILA